MAIIKGHPKCSSCGEILGSNIRCTKCKSSAAKDKKTKSAAPDEGRAYSKRIPTPEEMGLY